MTIDLLDLTIVAFWAAVFACHVAHQRGYRQGFFDGQTEADRPTWRYSREDGGDDA